MWRYNNNDDNYLEIWIFLLRVVFIGIVKSIIDFYQKHQILSIFIFVTIFSLIIFIIYKIISLKRERLMNINTIEDMQKLHWREFEKFIEFVFREKWFIANTRRWIKDWWIDLDAKLNWRKYLIQCKKWSKYKITEPNLREFYWAVMSFDKDAKWIYITTWDLTSDAKLFAKNHDIEVWEKENLVNYVNDFLWKNENSLLERTDKFLWKQNEVIINEKDKNIFSINNNDDIICNKCWALMILREAGRWVNKWNKFYWCSNYPKCKNIVNI